MLNLPSNLSTVINEASRKSTEQLRKEALAAVEAGEELDDSQLQTLTLEETKAIAAQQEQNVQEQVAAEAQEQQEVDEAEGFIATRTIDLQDGSGVQVFTGRGATQVDALNDLADRLQEAQRHATIKIKQQNRDLKQEQEDSEYINEHERREIEQRLRANPAAEIARIAKETLEAETSKYQRGQKAQQDFVDTHPDFYPCQENAQAMSQWIQGKGYQEFTPSNLEEAFQALQGKLVKKGDTPAATTTTSTGNRPTRKSSSVSTSRSSAPVVSNEPDEEALYKMPLDKLRTLADKQLADRAAERE
jgi:hypothetical protein